MADAETFGSRVASARHERELVQDVGQSLPVKGDVEQWKIRSPQLIAARLASIVRSL